MAATREMLEEYGRRNPDKAPLINEALRRGREPQWVADQLFPKVPAPSPSEAPVVFTREKEFGTITAPPGSVSTREAAPADISSGGMPLTTQPFTDPGKGGIPVTPQDIVSTGLGAAMVAAGMPQLAPVVAGIPAYLMTLPQGQGKAIEEGIVQALAEGPSSVISYMNKNKPLLKSMVDEEGEAVLRLFSESGDVPSLEMTTGGAWSKWISDVAEGALFAKKMEKYRDKILPEQIKRATDKTLTKIFASPVGEIQKGTIIRGAQEVADSIGKEIGDQFFDRVWSRVDQLGRTISLQSFEDAIGMARFANAKGVQGVEKAMLYRTAAAKMGDSAVGSIMSDVASLYEAYGDNVPLKEADELLQRIGKLWKPKMDRTAEKTITEAKNFLKDTIKSNMVDVPVDLGGGKTTTLWKQYQDARKYWGEFSNEFRNDFVDSAIVDMARKSPEFVARDAFKKGHITDMIRLKKVLSATPEVFEAVQRAHMQSRISSGILTKMANVPTGTEPIERLTGLSKEQLQVAYTKAQRESLADLARAIHRATQPTGPGKMAVQLSQVGFAVTLLGGGYFTDQQGKGAGSAAVVLLAPAILGRMFTNPNAVRLLTQGLRTPKTQMSSSLLTRILSNYIYEANAQKMEDMFEKGKPDGGWKPMVELSVNPISEQERFLEVKP